MRLLILIFLAVFTGTTCVAQNNELLRSRGLLPKNIVGTTQQQRTYEIQKRKNRNEVIGTDQYLLIDGTVSLCQRIAKSGRLMINDTMSSYANKVLDILLKDDPELRKKLCVYFYYSAGTNAVTLDNGMIIIQMGLLAHMENEAQLAFVLSHEICHYRENHFLKYLRFSKEIKNESDPMSSVLSYSREQEEEADSMGYEIYKKAGYPLSEAVVVFDMLKNSDMPEAQIPFNVSFFEHGLYKFPETYSESAIIDVAKETIDEKLSTHPSCDKRMDRMQEFLGELDPYGNYFLISQSVFNALRLMAREECCSLYLEDRDYGNAIYCAYALLKEDSTNMNAKKLLGKGLYNLAAYKVSTLPSVYPRVFIVDYDEDDDFNFGSRKEFEPVTPFDEVPGESQQLHYFLSRLDGKEAAILALEWNWKVHSEGDFKDPVMERMCDGLFFILAAYHDLKVVDFREKRSENRKEKAVHDSLPPMLTDAEKLNADLEKLKDVNIEGLSDEEVEMLLDKMEHKEIEAIVAGPGREYCYSAFDNINSDSLFFARFKELQFSEAYEKPIQVWENSDKHRKSSKGLGINKMYIIPPDYYRLREVKRTRTYTYNRAESLQNQKLAQTTIAANAKSIQKGYFVITPEVMDSTRVADYNTYCMLQQWLEEQNSHTSNRLALNLAHPELMDSLTKKLGTQYVMVSSIVTEKQKRVRHPGQFVVACIFPYTLPIAIIYGIIPRNRSQLISLVYDLKTGEMVMMYEDFTKTNAGPTQMSTFFTKVLRKTSRKP